MSDNDAHMAQVVALMDHLPNEFKPTPELTFISQPVNWQGKKYTPTTPLQYVSAIEYWHNRSVTSTDAASAEQTEVTKKRKTPTTSHAGWALLVRANLPKKLQQWLDCTCPCWLPGVYAVGVQEPDVDRLSNALRTGLLAHFPDAMSDKLAWSRDWHLKCVSFIRWHLIHGMRDRVLWDARSCFLDQVDHAIIAGRSIGHQQLHGDIKDFPGTTSRREHVVPCGLLVQKTIEMIEDGHDDSEVATMLLRNCAIVLITKTEQEWLDSHWKTSMPRNWSFGMDIFTRLWAAGIEWVDYGQPSSSHYEAWTPSNDDKFTREFFKGFDVKSPQSFSRLLNIKFKWVKTLRPGQRVQIACLQKQSHINGMIGILLHFVTEISRWEVQLYAVQ